MIPRSQLITVPTVKFDTLISVGEQALGHSVCGGIDRTSKKLSDAERFLSILASYKDLNAPVGFPPHLLAHISFSLLIAALDYDMLRIMEACSGMAFVQTETVKRSTNLAVISGTLLQWRDAVVTGSGEHQPEEVRLGFNEVHQLFVGAGLGAIWKDFQHKSLQIGYTLIE